MSAHRCCHAATRGLGRESIVTRVRARALGSTPMARRSAELAGWIIPSAILGLMPKCPACLAAYIAVWTGLGLSFSTATHLRALLLILCIASLLYLVARRLCRVAFVNHVHLRGKSHAE